MTRRVVKVQHTNRHIVLNLQCGHSVKKPSVLWGRNRYAIHGQTERCPQCGGYRK